MMNSENVVTEIDFNEVDINTEAGITAVAERLLASKRRMLDEIRADGEKNGREWATICGEYHQFAVIAKLAVDGIKDLDELAEIVSGDRRDRDFDEANGIFFADEYDAADESDQQEMAQAYLFGFADGAQEVFHRAMKLQRQ